MSTFVSVGNGTQRFPRLLSAVTEVADLLPGPIVVQHGNTPFSFSGTQNYPFLEMEAFERYMGSSELIITHAGAGSVLHAVRSGKVPIVMPRRMEFGELVDNHQVEFATMLAEAGAVIMVDDAKQMALAIDRVLAMQRDKQSIDTEPEMLTSIREALVEIEKDREA